MLRKSLYVFLSWYLKSVKIQLQAYVLNKRFTWRMVWLHVSKHLMLRRRTWIWFPTPILVVKHLCLQFQGLWCHLLTSVGTKYTNGTHIFMQAKHYIHKNNKIKYFKRHTFEETVITHYVCRLFLALHLQIVFKVSRVQRSKDQQHMRPWWEWKLLQDK